MTTSSSNGGSSGGGGGGGGTSSTNTSEPTRVQASKTPVLYTRQEIGIALRSHILKTHKLVGPALFYDARVYTIEEWRALFEQAVAWNMAIVHPQVAAGGNMQIGSQTQALWYSVQDLEQLYQLGNEYGLVVCPVHTSYGNKYGDMISEAQLSARIGAIFGMVVVAMGQEWATTNSTSGESMWADVYGKYVRDLSGYQGPIFVQTTGKPQELHVPILEWNSWCDGFIPNIFFSVWHESADQAFAEVPPQWNALWQQAQATKMPFKPLYPAISVGDGLPPEQVARWIQLTGKQLHYCGFWYHRLYNEQYDKQVQPLIAEYLGFPIDKIVSMTVPSASEITSSSGSVMQPSPESSYSATPAPAPALAAAPAATDAAAAAAAAAAAGTIADEPTILVPAMLSTAAAPTAASIPITMSTTAPGETVNMTAGVPEVSAVKEETLAPVPAPESAGVPNTLVVAANGSPVSPESGDTNTILEPDTTWLNDVKTQAAQLQQTVHQSLQVAAPHLLSPTLAASTSDKPNPFDDGSIPGGEGSMTAGQIENMLPATTGENASASTNRSGNEKHLSFLQPLSEETLAALWQTHGHFPYDSVGDPICMWWATLITTMPHIFLGAPRAPITTKHIALASGGTRAMRVLLCESGRQIMLDEQTNQLLLL
jgi:hypothetical protein